MKTYMQYKFFLRTFYSPFPPLFENSPYVNINPLYVNFIKRMPLGCFSSAETD